MISVICVYNNEQSLNDYLMSSLKKQTAKHELILVDNTKRRFKSAAQALNHGGKLAKGKYIMFVHQDVDLCSNSWLEEAEKVLDSIASLGAAGVAGMSECGRSNTERGRNIIEHFEDHRRWEWGNVIDKPERVQTLDECLVIVPKSVFDVIVFDEMTCDDWHLYVVDYCLSCIEKGMGVYAIPMFIYHRSGGGFFKRNKFKALLSLGSLPGAYYRTLEKLRRKHRGHFKKIYTTCGCWNLSYPAILLRVIHFVREGLRYIVSLLRGKS